MLSRLFVFFIDIYRVGISPYFPPSCRYQPTCSAYMREAILTHGPFKGLWMGLKRIGRCHPWSDGGYDPVPGSCKGHAQKDERDSNHREKHSGSKDSMQSTPETGKE
ncbi:MAG: membrane protein insertion efficiency factor YidD [Balneolales bacterium]|nr:membrane protein insertion efficiency factor YidD [Balneolales bacterium]